MKMRRLASRLGITVGVIFALGCQPDAKDLQIQALQEQLADKDKEIADLRSQLSYCYNERDAARNRANELERLLADAQRRLSAQPVIEPVRMGGTLPEGWQGTDQFAWVSVEGDILFDSGKADLKREAAGVIDRIAQQISGSFAGRNIFVVGHTDSDPIRVTKNLWKDNLDLSLNRAAAVTRELYNKGLPKDRVYCAGQGEWNPRGANDSRANKQRNRRVEIYAVAGSVR